MPRHLLVTAGFVITLLSIGVTGLAQSAAPRGEAMRPGNQGAAAGSYFLPAERMESVDPDAKLGPGDFLTVVIEEDREPGIPKVVSATGEIDVSPLKGRVKVAGRTTAEAAAEIKRLLEKDYYYSASVKLSLDRRSATAVKAGTITLSGEIRMVGPLDLASGDRLTVSQAVLKAGGFSPFANQRKVQVTRTEGGVSKQFYVDVKEVLDRGAVAKDVYVQDGDRINVARNLINF